MRCQHCNGLIIHVEGYGLNEPRDYCFLCGRELKLEVEVMNNHLNPEKEEMVKALLKDRSVRDIIKETGVAKNTIIRIRNENFTEEEKAELKNRANVKGRNKRELKKREFIEKNPMAEIEKKTCIRCGDKFLPTNKFFSKNKATPDGLERWCKPCKKAAQAGYRLKKRKENKPDGRFLSIKKKTIPNLPLVVKKPQVDRLTGASPGEIVIALRKSIASEIIANIQKEYDL